MIDRRRPARQGPEVEYCFAPGPRAPQAGGQPGEEPLAAGPAVAADGDTASPLAARLATKGTAAGKAITFAPLKTLAPKAKATFTVVAKGNAVGDVRFAVGLKSDQMKTPANETEATHIYK